MTSDIYGRGEKSKIMASDEEKEDQIAEYFLKSFEEKSPLDYDILDSMSTTSNVLLVTRSTPRHGGSKETSSLDSSNEKGTSKRYQDDEDPSH